MEPQGEAPAEEEVEVPQTPRVEMSPERIEELQVLQRCCIRY